MPGLVRGDRNQNRLSNRDAEIKESVIEKLREASISLGDSIECECRDGRLVISGTLPSYYRKQMAQECAGQVEGVRVVINEIRVEITETSPPA
jgi:osmotically-inducible protein OsmY